MSVCEYSSDTNGYDQDDLVALIPQMRAFARFLCRDAVQADDLTQDALANALKARMAFARGTNLKAWLFTILRNQFYSQKRRSWRIAPLDQNEAAETLVAVSDPMAALELADVHAAMSELCDDQREALVLVAVAGLAYAEAAVICGCAVGTMKSRVSRARAALSAILSGRGPAARPPIVGGAMAAFGREAQSLCSPDALALRAA